MPWRTHKYADVTRAVFDAFRKRGMGISAYYSRADFDCPYYWEEGHRWKDGVIRLPSYDPDEKPEVWKKYQDFVYAQLKELVTEYGKIDCLWFDGGCDGKKLGLPAMTEKLREYQPWMMGVIRGGTIICEDFLTPELIIPKEPVDVPWETCTVMGKPVEEYGANYTSFGYTFDQDYMSAKEVAHLLLDIVAKGGNLALNLAPQPDGRLPQRALRELAVLAKWMDIFGVGIYSTRAVAPYRTGKYAFTRTKDSKTVYAFYLYDDGENAQKEYQIPYTGTVQQVTDVRTGANLSFTQTADGIHVCLPEALADRAGDIADCFAIRLAK